MEIASVLDIDEGKCVGSGNLIAVFVGENHIVRVVENIVRTVEGLYRKQIPVFRFCLNVVKGHWISGECTKNGKISLKMLAYVLVDNCISKETL